MIIVSGLLRTADTSGISCTRDGVLRQAAVGVMKFNSQPSTPAVTNCMGILGFPVAGLLHSKYMEGHLPLY